MRDVSQRQAPPRLAWSLALDGLRAVAVLLVMFFHYGRDLWVPGGWLGVDIFFVLSGFLITTLLLQEWQASGAISLSRFYVRRALRLIPALAAFVAVYLCAAALFPETWLLPGQDVAHAARHSLYAATYVHNWVIASGSDSPHSFGHVWSLAVEAQFYLVWPLVLIAMLRAGLSRGVMLCATTTLALISGGSRLWTPDPTWEVMYYGTHFRAHELLIGAMAAQLLTAGYVTTATVRSSTYRAITAASVLLIAGLAVTANEHSLAMFTGGIQVASIGAAVVVLYLALAPQAAFSRLLASAPLAYVGRRSYAMYLWHLPVGYSLRALDPVPEALLATAITIAIAEISFRIVERPALRLKSSMSARGSASNERRETAQPPPLAA